MFIVTWIFSILLGTWAWYGLNFSETIEIRNVMKNQDDVKYPNKFSEYFAKNYFCLSYYFKIAMPWHIFHLPPLPRGSIALVGLGLQYEVSRSHSDTPHSVVIPERAIGPSQSSLTDNTQYSQETDTQAPGGIRARHSNKWAAVDPYLKPRGYLNWPRYVLEIAQILQLSGNWLGEAIVAGLRKAKKEFPSWCMMCKKRF
jgi:hypothetical protein